jgi:heme A synthase
MEKFSDLRPSSRRTVGRSARNVAPHRSRTARRSDLELNWTTRFSSGVDLLSAGQIKWFARFTITAAVAIIVQAVIAGQFVAQPKSQGWVFAHGLISYVTLAATLAAAIYAVSSLRKTQAAVTRLSVLLFALTAVQTVVGYLITVGGQLGWVGVHVPLAFVVFGLTGWLSLKAGAIARAGRSGPTEA